MRQAVEPFGQARNDFDIFAGLAERFDVAGSFTEGRDEMQWIERMYRSTRKSASDAGIDLPPFEEFWEGEQINLLDQLPATKFALEKFREDPTKNALRTPSGKIELFSETIASFGYDDCRGHPMWYDKIEWLGSDQAERFPLHLISNQPKTRLHSQLDHGQASAKAKIKGCLLYTSDAADE